MTVENDQVWETTPRTNSSTGSGGAFGEPGGSTSPAPNEMASAAKEQGAAVAHQAADAGKGVAHEAATQASAVAGQAKEQLQTLVGQARSEVKSQVESRGQQAATGLQTLSDQLSALAQGRPGDAGHVGSLIGDAQQRVQSYAQTLQQRGPQAVLDDLASFARRRPGAFLIAAVASGFAAGRLVRAGATVAKEQSSISPGAGSATAIAQPYPLTPSNTAFVSEPFGSEPFTPDLGDGSALGAP